MITGSQALVRNYALPLIAVVILATLTGCGGGGGGGGSSAGSGQAQNDLDNLIANTRNSRQVPSEAAVKTVQSEYANLLSSNPNNPTINAGYAITTAALEGIVVDSYSGYNLTANTLAKGQTSSLKKVGDLLCLWTLPSTLSSGSASKLTPLDLLPNLLPGSVVGQGSTITYAQAQTTLAAVDGQLKLAEKSIDFVLNNTSSSWVFPITNPTGTNPATVNLGKPEFEALRTGVSAARSVINVAIAYNLSSGNFKYGAVSTQFASVYRSGGTLTPSQYLPPSPFATLNTGGANDIATVSTELQATVRSAESTITGIQNRNSNGFLLNPGSLVSSAQLNTYLTDIQKYAPYLTQQVQISAHNGGPTTTLYLPALFNNPPADLKTLAPNITVSDPDSYGNVYWSAPVSNYPGRVNGYPSFDGLFPNGMSLYQPAYPYASHTGDQTNAGTVIMGVFFGPSP